MANTLPDVTLNNLVYQELYTETGIAVGTAIFIQNKAQSIRIQIQSSQPIPTSTDGVQIQPLEFFAVDSGESGVWVKGSGKVCVQVMGS